MKQPQIIINAADLTPEQFRCWIVKMAGDAEKAGGSYEAVRMNLVNASNSLRAVANDFGCRIDFLTSGQIIRSEEHFSAIRENLDTLWAASSTIRDAQNEISAVLALLDKKFGAEADSRKE